MPLGTQVFIDNALAAAPVSSLITVSWLFILFAAVHTVSLCHKVYLGK